MYALTRVRNLGWNNVKSYEIWMAIKHRLSSHSRTLLRISNMFLASPYHAQKNFYSDLKSRVITQKLKLFKKFCFILSFTCTKSTMKFFMIPVIMIYNVLKSRDVTQTKSASFWASILQNHQFYTFSVIKSFLYMLSMTMI